MPDRYLGGMTDVEAGVGAAAARIRMALEQAGAGLVERESLLEVMALAAVAQEHVLIIGPPGTAKSQAARRLSQLLGGRCFEYLLGRFTEPSELFGPVDLRRLKEGVVETATAGMLPEADVAFLDEVFQGSTAILNTLLGILNERSFRRGQTSVACPLRICIAASNALPEDVALAAFADRFLVRQFVQPVADPRLEDLLESGWQLRDRAISQAATLQDLDTLAAAARAVDMRPARPLLATAIRELRKAGVTLTDRRAVKVQQLMAAAAALGGRTVAGVEDVWTLVLAVPTAEQQALARDVLASQLTGSTHGLLSRAAEEMSRGPAARAARLQNDARSLLDNVPAQGDAAALRAWRLRLEGVAREVDASFAPGTLPEALVDMRTRVVRALQDGV